MFSGEAGQDFDGFFFYANTVITCKIEGLASSVKMADSSPSRTDLDSNINGEASSAKSPTMEQDSATAANPSVPRRLWKKLGLNGHMLMTMLKYGEYIMAPVGRLTLRVGALVLLSFL